jgi:hypothetical protein
MKTVNIKIQSQFLLYKESQSGSVSKTNQSILFTEIMVVNCHKRLKQNSYIQNVSKIECCNVKARGTFLLPLSLNASTSQGNKQVYKMFSTIANFMI